MLEMKNNIWLVLLLLLSFGLACSSGGQADEANKLVDEANVLVQKADEPRTKSNELFVELLGGNLTRVKDLEAYKKVNKTKFDEVISLREQDVTLMTEAADKFEQASKLDVDEKFKEYLGLLVQGVRKRIESEKLFASTCKSFLEAKDVVTVNGVIANHTTKINELTQEANDVIEKANQFSKDNPTIIKSN